ncbi:MULTISPECIES: polysaccharide deacetylase [unclassified Nocardioides]|uniref:polysaccharide deacetylase family protein n=1 Tax=unclassified Nocardioides TaxID=2615069 RepID=UPI00249C7AC8|nr:polysaccharide deacetylase [Nocardioides sp. LHD-245]WGX95890.1 polysaccharide deacetylase [Nocardioides sp. L-11A]
MRPTVCLTFDFDAISVWLGTLGLATPTYVSRGEFAANVATPRILDLLEREGVTSTWYIPGLDVDTYPDVCKRIRDAGHEIGHHGYAHEGPTTLDETAERRVLERGLDALDRVLGVRPDGYRSPAFDLSANSTRLLAEYGFRYDSSMMARDFEMYRCRTGDVISTDGITFGPELDLVEVPVSWTLDDFPFLEFALMPPMVMPASTDVEGLTRRWLSDLDFMAEEVPHGVFTHTFHPQSIGRGSRIKVLERMIHRAKEHDAVFSTVTDAVGAWQARTD